MVAFKFRGDTTPSTAEVVRVRETKNKSDAGDTVVTVHYDVKENEPAASTEPQTGDVLTHYAFAKRLRRNRVFFCQSFFDYCIRSIMLSVVLAFLRSLFGY